MLDMMLHGRFRRGHSVYNDMVAAAEIMDTEAGERKSKSRLSIFFV
jgi:hypothetical protein